MFSVGIGKLDRRSGGTDTPIDQHATGPTHEQADTPEPSARIGNVAVLRPSWLRVLAAPAVALLRPRMAAACLAAASRPAFVAVFVLGLLGYAAVLVALMLWHGTVEERWVSIPAPTSGPSPSAPTMGFIAPSGEWQTRERTLGEVWRQWHAEGGDGWFGTAELTLLLVCVLGTALLLTLAWLDLPLIHRSGSVWRSFKRSLRAATGILGPIAAATAACGTILIIMEHAAYRTQAFLGEAPGLFVLTAVAVTLWSFVYWLRAAARGVEPGAPLSAVPPRCEGCGYDLTHQPADRRCPECGLDLDASLVAGRSRPGSLWSRGRSVRTWWQTTVAVLVRPTSFYRALRLRTPDAAETGLAAVNYVLIGAGALVWICTLGLLASPAPALGWFFDHVGQTATYVGSLVLCGLFGCWVGHRTIAVLVFSWWLVRRELPDFRWAHKVAICETAFLWVFCIFWGTLATTFIVFGTWVSDLFGAGQRLWFISGFPADVWLVLLGTLVLAVLWLWRYEIAYRAIRWGNF